MSASGPGGTTPEEPDGTPSVPDDVWLKFLTDSERAIRASAPREPAARERLADGEPEPAVRPKRPGHPEHPGRPGRPREEREEAVGDGHGGATPVGELWQPEDPWTGPSWRELDGRARFRRVGRVVATAAAVALALTAWSQLSTGTGTPAVVPEGTTVERVEEAPAGVPTAASPSPDPARATGGPESAGPGPHTSPYDSPYVSPYASSGPSPWTMG
ncbi:hypothetical protein ACLGIH_10480 [Streptomyces sp. HMX87]|uniref:hypothetical protein n=1 Tax=Streptomyces sp. HMX87 TaxID=3390849 RepID=UPI003A855D1A